MTTLETIDAVTKLLGLFSIIFAGVALWQSSRYARKQWNLDAFTHYTNKYEQIMSSFPKNEYMLRFDLEQHIPSNEETCLAVLRYLNMTAEEHHLFKNGYISKEVWGIWLPEIQRTLQSPLFVREWLKLKDEFTSYREFSKFVERTQAATNLMSSRYP